MTATKVTLGRGSKILVAPIGANRIIPESTVFAVTTAASAAATSLDVSLSPATTRVIEASTTTPLYLNFTDPDGISHLVIVTADIPAGATATLTVAALKKDIPLTADAPYPIVLQKRTSANITSDDQTSDVITFDNDGWGDKVTTLLNNGIDASGFYDALDAGWNTCWRARLQGNESGKGEVYVEVQLPIPPGYTTGHIVKMFSGIDDMPIEIPPADIINSNITFMNRGPVTFVDPT